MSEFHNAFADATKANEAMKDAYQTSVSDNENFKLTIGTYEQAMSDIEQQHATTLQAKDALVANMQHHINDNLEMLAEHEERKRQDDKFFLIS